MTPEEREKMDDLARRIQTEKDPRTFEALVAQLIDLIEVKHERLRHTDEPGTTRNPSA